MSRIALSIKVDSWYSGKAFYGIFGRRYFVYFIGASSFTLAIQQVTEAKSEITAEENTYNRLFTDR